MPVENSNVNLGQDGMYHLCDCVHETILFSMHMVKILLSGPKNLVDFSHLSVLNRRLRVTPGEQQKLTRPNTLLSATIQKI